MHTHQCSSMLSVIMVSYMFCVSGEAKVDISEEAALDHMIKVHSLPRRMHHLWGAARIHGSSCCITNSNLQQWQNVHRCTTCGNSCGSRCGCCQSRSHSSLRLLHCVLAALIAPPCHIQQTGASWCNATNLFGCNSD
jgi:hypothetical protein